MRQRKGESIEEFRIRSAAARRERYARQKAEGRVPTDLLRNRRYYVERAGTSYIPAALRSTDGECREPGCTEPILARKLCYRHYRAAQRAAGVPWACEGNKAFKAPAARHGVEYEPVNRLRVFERDGWLCGICGNAVERDEASLDHVIPMSKGGPHTYANTQCAHLLCNIKKGATVDEVR